VQVLPAMLGGMFWRGATRYGAAAGMILGFGTWAWTFFLPSFGVGAIISIEVMVSGPFGIGWLRPQALFGISGLDPVVHAVMWSLLLNGGAFFLGSVLTFPTPLERLQGAQFVNVFELSPGPRSWTQGGAEAEDLLVMSQRIIGAAEAQAIFHREAAAQGREGYLPDVTPGFVERLERELAGSVGAATAHAMIGQLVEGASVSVEDLIRVADEAAQILETSNRLEAKSAEQERTARQLRDANEKLTALSIQKDAFLSQISHELRTPMTSVRAFSEILRDGATSPDEQRRYAGIIHDEAIRLTRLLDDLLDLSVLENGQVTLNRQTGLLREVLDRAVSAAGLPEAGIAILRRRADEAVPLVSDLDRLSQVFINVIANAQKYCTAPRPQLRIDVRRSGGELAVDFIDNGRGIEKESQQVIFEKFSRLADAGKAGGAGLGLAICREVMLRLGGSIDYLPGQGGAAFRVTLPVAPPEEPGAA
jgi:signal transduction histidine kinase